MLLTESILAQQTVDQLLREVLITSMGILTGLTFRDFILSITSYLNPEVKREQIVYTLFIFMVVLFATIVMTIVWN